jgi:predicted ATP-grasp superfamily ATP-dependent carboligase
MNTKKELNNLTIRKTMNTVEINKSIMELNFRKEKLNNEVEDIQAQINFLANLREWQRMDDDKKSDQSLFNQMFGGTD